MRKKNARKTISIAGLIFLMTVFVAIFFAGQNKFRTASNPKNNNAPSKPAEAVVPEYALNMPDPGEADGNNIVDFDDMPALGPASSEPDFQKMPTT